MKDRLKLLRHKLAVTQSEFGKSIGRSLISIQQYEAGTRKLDESMLLLIEKTFNVNPSWLREGIGEMFCSKQDNVFIEDNANRRGMDSRDALIMAGLRMATEEQKDFILKYIEEQRELSELREQLKNNKKEQSG